MKAVMTIIFSTMLIKVATSLTCNVNQHDDTRWTLIECSNLTSPSEIQFSYTDTNNFKQVLSIVDSNIPILPPKEFSRFSTIDELWLTNNQIEELTAGSFDGLENLQQIYLAQNELTDVPEGVFTSYHEVLTFLHMGENNIEPVSKNAFKGLADLKFLHLQQNQIAKLEKGVFCDLTNLRVLALSENLLTEFNDYKMFSNSTDDGKNFSHNLGYLYLGNNRIRSFVVKHLRQLHWIDFTFNYLSYLEPDSFTGMSELSYLDLSNNFIKKIPAQLLRGNVKLENIYWYNNTISILEQGVFQDLFELVQLNMNNNSLTEFHDFSLWGNSENIVNVSKNLRDIKVGYNSITSGSVSNCKAVRIVYFEHNKLTHLKPDGFKDLPNLKELDFSHNTLKSLPRQVFQGAVNLELLFLDNNSITKLECGIFKDLKNLQTLALADNRLEEFDDCCLFGDPSNLNFACNNTKLTYLLLDNNFISSVKLVNSPNIKYIRLDFNKISCVKDSNFGGLSNLVRLDLTNNYISEFLGNSLKGDVALEEVKLENNKISKLDPGTFSDQTNLKQLNMSNNLLSEFNIQNLWKSNNTNLAVLDLSKNSLSTFYVASENLNSISLAYNNISYLRPGVFRNIKSLLTIDLSHNNIHQLQFGVLQNLTSLQNLDLSYNKLKKFDHYLLSGKTNLENLDLSNNKIDDFSVANLKEHLTNLVSVSLANNSFTCGALSKLEYDLQKLNVTLVEGDAVDVQNVGGIACDADEEYRYVYVFNLYLSQH